MTRFALVLAMAGCMACNGADSGPGDGGTGSAEATIPGSREPSAAARPMEGAVAVDPSVGTCLDLVRAREFRKALPLCTRAAAMEPENEAVQQALEQAKAETMKAEPIEAAEDAAAEAESAVEGAKQDLGGRLP